MSWYKSDFFTLRNVLKFLILLILVYVFYQLYILIKSFINGSKNNPFYYDINKCRISDMDAKAQADLLYDAMFSQGTDEEKVFSIISEKNKDELIQLYNQFGYRLYFNWIIGKTFRYIPLFDWFKEEFSGDELNRLKNIWAKTLIPW